MKNDSPVMGTSVPIHRRLADFLASYFDSTARGRDLIPKEMKVDGDGDLWPVTYVVLHELSRRGIALPHIEAHDSADKEGVDILWYVYTPDHPVSKGSFYSFCQTLNLVVVNDVDSHNAGDLITKESIRYVNAEMTELELVASYIEVSVRASLRGEGSYAGFNARHPETINNAT